MFQILRLQISMDQSGGWATIHKDSHLSIQQIEIQLHKLKYMKSAQT